MQNNYDHRQLAPWPLAVLGFFVVRRLLKRGKKRKIVGGLTLGFALFMLQFCMLSTRVDESGVSWAFGLGFPNGFIPLSDITGAELTTTQRWEGWGIHWSPQHGWIWNIAGRSAVTIRKRLGQDITLGTDDASGLYNAIASRINLSR
jgi:hypothetical protein